MKFNCDCERVRDKYTNILTQLTDRHRMYDKLARLTDLSSLLPVSEFQVRLNGWDAELADYMRGSEDMCRKFKMNYLEWSPKVGV